MNRGQVLILVLVILQPWRDQRILSSVLSFSLNIVSKRLLSPLLLLRGGLTRGERASMK